MSYLVLARKYRPASFEQVVGQEHITQTLAGALKSGRLAHAFCFTGPRGVGKTSVARILAKALNCEHGPTASPCGQCVACREIEEGRAVDVQEIDAASNSGVEDVRELREMIRYRPQSGRYRITILDEVHMLSRQAFNALLKTLEEPPEHAVFILATTDVHKLPATILSRCQRYDFRRLSPKLLAGHLAQVCEAEGFSLPEESIMLLSQEADGSTRDGLSLLDQILSYGERTFTHSQVVELLGLVDRTLVKNCASAILEGNGAVLLDIIEQVYQAGGEMQAFYSNLQEHFRNLAASLAIPQGQSMLGLTLEEINSLRSQAAEASPESLHEIFANLAAAEEMFRRASSPRLVMEMTLLKLTQLKPVVDLNKIIDMLENSAPAALELSPAQLKALLPANQAADDAGWPEPTPAQNQEAPPAVAPDTSPQKKNTIAENLSTQGDAARLLRQLADYILTPEPALATCLRQASASWQDGALAIELRGGNLTRHYCTPQKQEVLCGYAAELWDNPPAISMSVLEGPVEEKANIPSQEVCNHPSIRAAIDILQAQPVEIKPWTKQNTTPQTKTKEITGFSEEELEGYEDY